MVAAKPIFSHVRGEGCPMALRVIKYSMCASRVGGGVPSTSGVALDYIAMEVRPSFNGSISAGVYAGTPLEVLGVSLAHVGHVWGSPPSIQA